MSSSAVRWAALWLVLLAGCAESHEREAGAPSDGGAVVEADAGPAPGPPPEPAPDTGPPPVAPTCDQDSLTAEISGRRPDGPVTLRHAWSLWVDCWGGYEASVLLSSEGAFEYDTDGLFLDLHGTLEVGAHEASLYDRGEPVEAADVRVHVLDFAPGTFEVPGFLSAEVEITGGGYDLRGSFEAPGCVAEATVCI